MDSQKLKAALMGSPKNLKNSEGFQNPKYQTINAEGRNVTDRVSFNCVCVTRKFQEANGDLKLLVVTHLPSGLRPEELKVWVQGDILFIKYKLPNYFRKADKLWNQDEMAARAHKARSNALTAELLSLMRSEENDTWMTSKTKLEQRSWDNKLLVHHYIHIEWFLIKGVRTLFFSRKVLSYQDLDSENQDFYSENQSTDSDFQKTDADNQSTDADNQNTDAESKRSLTLIISGHL